MSQERVKLTHSWTYEDKFYNQFHSFFQNNYLYEQSFLIKELFK